MLTQDEIRAVKSALPTFLWRTAIIFDGKSISYRELLEALLRDREELERELERLLRLCSGGIANNGDK